MTDLTSGRWRKEPKEGPAIEAAAFATPTPPPEKVVRTTLDTAGLAESETPPEDAQFESDKNSRAGSEQPASLLVPIWVTKANMKDTVIKDNFVDKAALCAKVTAAVCTAAGIS